MTDDELVKREIQKGEKCPICDEESNLSIGLDGDGDPVYECGNCGAKFNQIGLYNLHAGNGELKLTKYSR